MCKKELRRNNIITMLNNSKTPLSGSLLANKFHVTRQVIVGDIAKLRIDGYQIISTARGYQLLPKTNHSIKRKIVCMHTESEIEKELSTIIKLGGIVHNVLIEHDIYGDIEVSLYLRTLDDIKDYIKKQKQSQNALLSSLSSGIHIHLIETETVEIMENIIQELTDLGYIYQE